MDDSTTFTALWTARQQHVARDQPDVEVGGHLALVATWQVEGIGWRHEGDALLARAAREQHKFAGEAAGEARREMAEILAIAG